MNEKFCILINISPKFVPRDPIDNNPVPNRRQAIIWSNADPIHWCIYAALGGDELMDHQESYKNRWYNHKKATTLAVHSMGHTAAQDELGIIIFSSNEILNHFPLQV